MAEEAILAGMKNWRARSWRLRGSDGKLDGLGAKSVLRYFFRLVCGAGALNSWLNPGVVMPGFVLRRFGRALAPVAYKLYTFTDYTQRETRSQSFVTYNSFRIEAPSGKALWLLSVRFYREMWRVDGEAQSHLLFDGGPAVAGAASFSNSPVAIITHSPLGFVVPPKSSANVVIQYRNRAGYTAFMRNVRVDILYAEVQL